MRIYIRNYAHQVNALTKLTHKDVPFEWGPQQNAAQKDIKQAVLDCPALKPIDYTSDSPVILTIDMSQLTVGYYLCQEDSENPRKHTYNTFSSITLNDHEMHFSQPKLELYRLYCALCTLRLYIIGVQNLIIETDACYIKGMLQNLDIQPSVSMNHWIVSILMFHFTLVHVRGAVHGPDGLSCRPRQPEDPEDSDDEEFEDWINAVHGFVHTLHPVSHSYALQSLVLTQPELTSNAQHLRNAPHTYDDDYSQVPHSLAADEEDKRLDFLWLWMDTLQRLDDISDTKYSIFLCFATGFFKDSKCLWRCHVQGAHQLIIWQSRQLAVLRSLHSNIGHK
jgi:RNase H-like domain found in reverse transcriptase